MDRQGRNSEQQIIDLLGRLKDSDPDYPWEMKSQRRAAVLASLAVVPAVGGFFLAVWLARLVKMVKAMAVVDKIILGVEVAAITGLTGYGAATAYVYRNELRQLILPASIHTPFPTLSIPTLGPLPSQPGAGPQASPEPIPSAQLTGTPPILATPSISPTMQAQETSQPAVSTPKSPATKPGNRYGVTKNPKPTGKP